MPSRWRDAEGPSSCLPASTPRRAHQLDQFLLSRIDTVSFPTLDLMPDKRARQHPSVQICVPIGVGNASVPPTSLGILFYLGRLVVRIALDGSARVAYNSSRLSFSPELPKCLSAGRISLGEGDAE